MKIYTNKLGHITFVYLENVKSFEIKFLIKAYGRMRMKSHTNKLGHVTKMAA